MSLHSEKRSLRVESTYRPPPKNISLNVSSTPKLALKLSRNSVSKAPLNLLPKLGIRRDVFEGPGCNARRSLKDRLALPLEGRLALILEGRLALPLEGRLALILEGRLTLGVGFCDTHTKKEIRHFHRMYLRGTLVVAIVTIDCHHIA